MTIGTVFAVFDPPLSRLRDPGAAKSFLACLVLQGVAPRVVHIGGIDVSEVTKKLSVKLVLVVDKLLWWLDLLLCAAQVDVLVQGHWRFEFEVLLYAAPGLL